MKNLIVSLAALAMIATAANVNAQPQGGKGKQTPEQKVQMLKDKVGISDDQGAQILKIYQDADTKAANLTGEDKAEVMKKAHTDVENVLTPDQKAKMAAAHNQGGDKGKAAPAGKGGKKGGGKKGGGDSDNGGGGGDE